MTPKEKAKKLVDKFSDLEDGEMYIGKAKQCALITVDEIMRICPYQTYIETLPPYEMPELTIDFWEEVKQEISNL